MECNKETAESQKTEELDCCIEDIIVYQEAKNTYGDELPHKRQNPSISQINSSIPRIIPLLLAQNKSNEDPKNWWMSEKLDGVRCYWNGKCLISRQGNAFSAPHFFIKNLPDSVSLDGELWLGRKMFQECVSIARCTDNGKNDMNRWYRMRYMIFDAPSLNTPFEERIQYIKSLIRRTNNPYIKLVEQTLCNGESHMLEELARIEELGGEGIMLRKPKSLYENKRSKTLIKVKSFCDAEAVIIGYEDGKGKYEGHIGALKVRNLNGKEFKIGSGFTDAERLSPPEIGSMITYKYQELSKDGIPRFPIFYRKKHDI